MDQIYTLRDGLRHPHFSWPDSLVFLPGQPVPDGGHLVDEAGRVFAAQNVRMDGRDCAAVVTSLACGQEKTFSVVPGRPARCLEIEETEDGWRVRTCALTLRLFRNGGLIFDLASNHSSCAAEAALHAPWEEHSRTITFLQRGDVFADVRIAVGFAGGQRYELTLRVVEGLDYVGMTEDMQLFAAEDQAELRLEWRGFDPQYRQNRYRKTELIDQYLDADGRMPMSVAPFDSWVSWWMDKSVSFMDGQAGYSAGVFIYRADLWDDHEYALWRSSNTLAVRFYYVNGRLSFRYPLREGSRGTAVTIFSNELEAEGDFGGSADGLYGQSGKSPMSTFYTERQWFWQEWINLDKVQGWTLRWEGDQAAFPRFFPPEGISQAGMNLWYLGNCRVGVTPAQVEKVVCELSDSMNQMIRTGPVSNREFYDWAIMFDQAIPAMTERQFDDLKAAFAFCAYAFSDENFMPIRHMLSGHPNFLADARGVAAVAAALFPEHPDARRWKNEYELAMARNLKYHVRPDVKKWDCTGGRWTENLGCYVFAMLRPMCHAQMLLDGSFGDHTVLYSNLPKLMEWLIGTVSAPVNGVRCFPQAGAHSYGWLANQYELTLWGDALARYAPMTAERLWYIGDVNGSSFEERTPGASMYRRLAGKAYADMTGTRPELKSAKYTGYGCVLRSRAHEPDEMAVQLIQIDEGPNYRWGRAGSGGCGNIFYYANNAQYSGHRREDVGDWNKGAAQSCCNFGVLIGHEFVSVGRNDLTEPLYDFGFAQYARVNAGEKAAPFYRYRSVLMSGNDYIAVYDAVGDKLVHGRFAWFNSADAPFPDIVQVKPGAAYVESNGGIPIDQPDSSPDDACRGRYYDGQGDFLTLVSHRPMNCDRGVYTTPRAYGVQVDLSGRTDYVFDSAATIRFAERGLAFRGHAGIIRVYGENRVEAALFDGKEIAAGGVTLRGGGCRFGAGFTLCDGILRGAIQTEEEASFTLSCPAMMAGYALAIDGADWPFARAEDGVRFTVSAGKHCWEWTNRPIQPMAPVIVTTVSSAGQAEVVWMPVASAASYLVELSRDGGKTWREAAQTRETRCIIRLDAANAKAHVRVRGVNGSTAGEACWDYPVYATDKPPLPPEGLKVWREGEAWRVSWGKQTGVSAYRLYRRRAGESGFECVYSGADAAWLDQNLSSDEAWYAVSAINGQGEGACSLVRGTRENGLEDWDPMPEEIFRRYAPSHEYGYRGFDFYESYTGKDREPYPD